MIGGCSDTAGVCDFCAGAPGVMDGGTCMGEHRREQSFKIPNPVLHERPSVQRLQFDPLSFPAGIETFTYSTYVHGESAKGLAYASAVEDGDAAAQGMRVTGEQGSDVHFDRRSGGTASGIRAERRSLR